MADNKFLGKIDPEIAEEVISRSPDGEPIFKLKDICMTTHPLAQMVRYFLASKKMTKNMLKQLHKKLAIKTCMSTNKTSFDFSNMFRSITQSKASWESTEKLFHVAGEELVDLVYVLRNSETGEITELKRSDAIQALADDPYPDNLMMDSIDRISIPNDQ